MLASFFLLLVAVFAGLGGFTFMSLLSVFEGFTWLHSLQSERIFVTSRFLNGATYFGPAATLSCTSRRHFAYSPAGTWRSHEDQTFGTPQLGKNSLQAITPTIHNPFRSPCSAVGILPSSYLEVIGTKSFISYSRCWGLEGRF